MVGGSIGIWEEGGWGEEAEAEEVEDVRGGLEAAAGPGFVGGGRPRWIADTGSEAGPLTTVARLRTTPFSAAETRLLRYKRASASDWARLRPTGERAPAPLPGSFALSAKSRR